MKKMVLAAMAACVIAVPVAAQNKPLSFPEMDTDGSKTVTLAEWKAGHRGEAKFTETDANKDGVIDMAEWKENMARWKAMQAQKEGGAAAAPAAAPAGAKKGGGSFKDFDTDSDGKVSAAEWTAAGRNPAGFKNADADKDGGVTMEEMKAFYDRMAANRR